MIPPGSNTLNDPTAWEDDEADLVCDFADDLDANIGGACDAFGVVAAVELR